MSIRNLPVALALFGLVLAQGASAANRQDMKSNLMSACQSDLNKYCKDITPGEGRPMACLKAHDDKLSDTCNTQWTQAKQEWRTMMKQARAACKDDVNKYCSNATDPMEVSSCLDSHQSDLSSSCKNFRMQAAGMKAPSDTGTTSTTQTTTTESAS